MTTRPPLPSFWGGPGSPPEIDYDQVRPTVQEVAALERTRTVDNFGNEYDTFMDDPPTRPSASEVQKCIDTTAAEVLGVLPTHADLRFWAPIRQVIAVRASERIECSWFREQAQAEPQSPGLLRDLQRRIPTATYIG